jgi:NAD(P)-dependent dehydrogenase (short-subunit alcohol dehydrogenase family)
VLVVGGSSGIGRAVAVALGRRGDAVAVAARRADLLAGVVAEAGPTCHGLRADAADPEAARELVERAADRLDGLDAVVYAAGRSTLRPLSAGDAGDWHRTLATNVVGPAVVLSAAGPHLAEGTGPTAVLLSSHSVGRPWPGLVPYAASKAALDQLALGLRAEEPWLRVVRVVVGPTATPFADGWDPDEAGARFEAWAAGGYLVHQVQTSEVVAARVVNALDDPTGGDEVRIVGPETAG